jgi:hypothetical protein
VAKPVPLGIDVGTGAGENDSLRESGSEVGELEPGELEPGADAPTA